MRIQGKSVSALDSAGVTRLRRAIKCDQRAERIKSIWKEKIEPNAQQQQQQREVIYEHG